MSERLDRIEAGLEETRKIVDSNAKAIESWANQTAEYRQQVEEYRRESEARDRRLNETLTQLANIVYTMANRQDDHENRINRIEQD